MPHFCRPLALLLAAVPIAVQAYIPLTQIQIFDVSAGMDINNHQEVVGGTSSSQDFIWSQVGGLRRIGTNANYGINTNGWICGAFGTGTSARGFIYRFGPGTIPIDVDPRGGYSEIAIELNDNGTVIGNLFAPNGLNNGAFVWDTPNNVTVIPPLLGDTFFKARDINNAGIIVGQSFRTGGPATAAAYIPGVGTQPLAGNEAIAINDNGDYITNFSGVPKLYNLNSGFIRDIADTPAQDISNNGYVLTNGAVIRPDGTVVSVRSLVQGYPDWDFLAIRINNKNEIVGRMAPKSGGQSSPFILSPGPFKVIPNAFAVSFGQIGQGDINSLLSVDNDAFRMCKYIVPNQVVAPVSVQVSGKMSTGDLEALSVRMRSRMVHPGTFEQRLALFDFSLGQYSMVDRRNDSLGQNWTDVQIMSSQDPNRYVSTSGTTRMRYEVYQVGISALSLWCHDADLVEWEVKYKL